MGPPLSSLGSPLLLQRPWGGPLKALLASGAPTSFSLSTRPQRPVLSFASVPEGSGDPPSCGKGGSHLPACLPLLSCSGGSAAPGGGVFPSSLTLSPRASLSCELSGKRWAILKMHFTEDVGQGKINPRKGHLLVTLAEEISPLRV